MSLGVDYSGSHMLDPTIPSLAISRDNRADIGYGPRSDATLNWNVVGGFPIVISGGTRIDVCRTTALNCRSPRTNSRTAAGVTAANELILAVNIDYYRGGLTVDQMIDVLVKYGVVDGMLLDGGPSSTMLTRTLGGEPVYRSALGFAQREILTALAVYQGDACHP